MLNKCYVIICTAAAAKSLQSCPTLRDPIDGSPPGSPLPGILQARTLEWVAISFSNAGKWKVKAKSLSRVQLLATPWTAAYQAPPSMGFSRQEYWSGVPLPSLNNMHYSELIQCFSNNNQKSFYNTQHDHRYLKVHLQSQFLTQPFIDAIRTLLTSLGSQKSMTYLSISEVFGCFFFTSFSRFSYYKM